MMKIVEKITDLFLLHNLIYYYILTYIHSFVGLNFMARYNFLNSSIVALGLVSATLVIASNVNAEIINPQLISELPIGTSGDNSLPTFKVIKQEFTSTKGWRIIWDGGSYSSENWTKVPSIFSTVSGAVNSIDYLNKTSWNNTNNADIGLYFGKLQAPSEIKELNQKDGLKATKFKLSTLEVKDLETAAKTNPQLIVNAYNSDDEQPVNTTPKYKVDQIYVFKTDRGEQSKYGAVRIVSISSKTIIEVVVQK